MPPAFPHDVETNLRIAGDVWVEDGAKLGHWPYLVARGNQVLERKHRGYLVLAIAETPITVTLPPLDAELDSAVFRIRHFGGTESVTIRGAGATKLDNDLDAIQVAPGGWYDCLAVFELTTWALTGNDRVIREAVFMVRGGQEATAQPDGFYTLQGRRGRPATLMLPKTTEMPGALVYAFVVNAAPDAPAIIQCSDSSDTMDGRREDGNYAEDPVWRIEAGTGWAITLRSDGNGFWVIV